MYLPVMEAQGLDHLHIFVTDLDKAVGFYRLLGFQETRRFQHGGRKAAQLKAPFGLTIDLNEARASDNPGFNHFCLVVSDVDAAAEELRGAGLWVDGPVSNPETGRRLATTRGPNGFLVQLVGPPNPSPSIS